MHIGTSLKRLCTVAAVGVVLLAIPTTASAATPDVVTETATGAGSQSFALTIDDGPSPAWTPQVLDVLKAHGVHATFCLVGDHAAAYPDLVQRIAAEGHHLCNHTMHHTNLTTQTPDQQRADIQATSDAIHAAVPDANIEYFRAPEGAWTSDATQYAAQQGMQPIGWSVDTEDWRTPGVDTIFQNYKREFSGGGVILMHDGSQENDRSQSVAAMDQILTDLAGNNFTDDVPAVR